MARQIEDCERLAERKVWSIAALYVDDDVSAWSGKRRPEYARMLADLETGTINGLLVYDLDRLHRQPSELESFIDLCQRLGLTNVASVSGDIDLTTADGQFQARILGAVAKKESDDKSRRIRRRLCGDHAPPVEVGTPRLFKSWAIERTGSPASSRFAHSAITAASAGRIVSLSASYP